MSKQDLKDEHKRREGDPIIKRRIRDHQRELMEKIKSSSNVKNADVVVVNPTHYAVCLKFDINKDVAPIITAKGKDYWALSIKQVARDHGRPIVESAQLARTLYEYPLHTPVPESSYAQVGSIYRSHDLIKQSDHSMNVKSNNLDNSQCTDSVSDIHEAPIGESGENGH